MNQVFHTFEPEEAAIVAKTYEGGLCFYVSGGSLRYICQPHHYAGATYTFDLSTVEDEEAKQLIKETIDNGVSYQDEKRIILGATYMENGDFDYCLFMGETPTGIIDHWKKEEKEV